jgi:flagellar basal-body rod protein FlgF
LSGEKIAAFGRVTARRALPGANKGTGKSARFRKFAPWHGPCTPRGGSTIAPEGGTLVENTFLVGLSQLIASRRSMEVIANNLANLSTPAYKKESVAFEQYLMNVPATEAEGGGTVQVAFVLDRGVVRDIASGRLEQTNGALDFALSGPGYFVVDTPEGERYTRNGHFQLDNQGRVVTDDGNVVQSDGGAIAIQQQDSDIQVGPDGTISIRNQVGAAVQLLGKMRIVTFADERTLKKAGMSLFDAEGQPAIPATGETRVHQGVVEKSNVEPVVEITKMIDVLRAYQSMTEMTKASEELEKRAIEQLGTVPQA